MKIASVLPIPMAKDWAPKAGALFGMHLCLADKVLEDPGYRDTYSFCVKRGDYVIVDNGAAENGFSVSAKDLLEAAMLIGAQEIVAPDVIEDADQTIHLTEVFLADVGEQLQNSNIRIMIVPQGKTGHEWMLSLQTMYELLKSLGLTKRVIIGVPKHLDNKVAGGRASAIRAIVSGWGAPFKFHMLGSGEYLCRDIWMAKRQTHIRSLDSSLPAALAQTNRKLKPALGRNGTLCDFHQGCDEHLLGLNLLEVKKWLSKAYSCPLDSTSITTAERTCASCLLRKMS